MAEADLAPTTFTSMSASDPDYDISTEDSSENENENAYTEASSDNSSSHPETETKYFIGLVAPHQIEWSSRENKHKGRANLSERKMKTRTVHFNGLKNERW